MPSRILALDYGTKRIGVALSDELGWTAQPLETIERRILVRDIAHIEQLVLKHEVKEVLIGLPLRLDGEEGPAVQAVHEFIAHLGEALSVSIVTWDERMTTRSAEDLLITADVSRRKRKGVVDRVAAAILLQSYLESQTPAKTHDGRTSSEEIVEEWGESLPDSPAYDASSHPHRVPRGRRTRRVGRVPDDSMG